MSNSTLLRTNAKLAKDFGLAANYMIGGLTLAPHGLSGHQVCNGSTIGCRAACNLWFSGQRVTPVARNRAIEDTRWLFRDRGGFIDQLHRDISRHVRRAERFQLTPLVRLNVASDLDWTDVITRWPNVQFYDYTKIKSRFRDYLDGKLPSNYVLTFSASERSHSATLRSFLSRGGNVAFVFDVPYHPQSGKYGTLPATKRVHGAEFAVIDADKHDVRLPNVDGRGVICGLRLKGTNAAKARARKARFAI